MNLTVRIHDKEYTKEIAQGVTFSEEYNETLDSGSVRICHVEQIDNLRPYDDVYIYESCPEDYEDPDNYFNDYIGLWRKSVKLSDGGEGELPFYRHLLVDNFTEEIVNLEEGIFSYSIELFSETKGLEMVQVPNISVTQPLNVEKKIDIYEYLNRFVNLYSPKYKTLDRSTSGTKKWKYAKKYSVAPELKEIFGGVYSQDFSLSNPTLRDVLSTLMITKDMIPYVKDNVIYAKAISERVGNPYVIDTEKKESRINMVVGQMSSADYCDGVRRQYSNALSQSGTCHFVEHLGFRNKNNAIMTLSNMQLETTHPLYKVDEFLMCYYKKCIVAFKDTSKSSKTMWFLCKQDITPLIKLNSEWELLSQDWKKQAPTSINDLAQYKLSTVTYNLGGNAIIGWGTRYNKYRDGLLTAYDIEKTYIENLFTFVDNIYKFGISTENELKDYYISNIERTLTRDDILSIIPQSANDMTESTSPQNILSHVYQPTEELDSILKFKTFFFEIKYEGFYNGALIHSRDKGNDNFFQNDNQSAALTLLEKDGFSQKEKLNRFANKTVTMKGRLDGENYGVGNLLKLGQTGAIGNDDDVIIYRREYSIFDNYILVSYAGINDYVLKNFYTSVYARYRTNQLMSYGESTTRAETRKVMLLLSKDKKFKDEEDTFLKIENNGEDVTNKVLFSAFEGNQTNETINNAIITAPNYNSTDDFCRNYYVDLQTFTSGNSLCFNVSMSDNASGGNYISNWVSPYQVLMNQPADDSEYYVGSTQKWLKIVDDEETGAIDTIGFRISHAPKKEKLLVEGGDDSPYLSALYNYNASLPKAPIDREIYPMNILLEEKKNNIILQQENLFKDNKEMIDMTIQIEPISIDKKSIFFGESLMKLSNLCAYHKYNTDVQEIADKNIEYDDNLGLVFYYDNFNWELRIIAANDAEFDTQSEKKEAARQAVADFVKRLTNTYHTSSINFDLKIYLEEYLVGDDPTTVYVFNANRISYEETGNKNRPYIITLHGDGQVDDIKFDKLKFELFYSNEYYKCKISKELIDPAESSGPFYGKAFVQKEGDEILTYHRNMFVDISNSLIDYSTTTKIIPYVSQPEFINNPLLPENIFKITGGVDSSIRIELKDEDGNYISGISETTKSISFWYFDFDLAYSKKYQSTQYAYNYEPQKSGYQFVFGVNLTKEDHSRGYVDIYITKITHRDERVFDSVGREVGKIKNCVTIDENGEIEYTQPTEQEYEGELPIGEPHNVNIVVEPASSGFVENDGVFYDGEIALLKFIPNKNYEFYQWKYENAVVSKDDTYSFVVKSDVPLRAQCVADYNISNTKLDNQSEFKTDDSTIKIFEFNRDRFNDVEALRVSIKFDAKNKTDLIGLTTPTTSTLNAEIDCSKNISEDTAVIISNLTLLGPTSQYIKVWYSNGAVYAKGQAKLPLLLNSTTPISIYMDTVDARIVGNVPQATLTLDFSKDDKVESVTIDRYRQGVIGDPDTRIINREDGINHVVDLNYGGKLVITTKTSDLNNIVAPIVATSGLDMYFAPTTKTARWTTVIDYSSVDGYELRYTNTSLLGFGLITIEDTSSQLLLNAAIIAQNGWEEKRGIYTSDLLGFKVVLDINGEEKEFLLGSSPVEIDDILKFSCSAVKYDTDEDTVYQLSYTMKGIGTNSNNKLPVKLISISTST